VKQKANALHTQQTLTAVTPMLGTPTRTKDIVTPAGWSLGCIKTLVNYGGDMGMDVTLR